MRFTTPTIAIAGSVLLGVLGGCVPQSQYDDLMTGYRSKEQQVLTLQGDLDSARANEEALRMQLAQAADDLRMARDMALQSDGNIDEMRQKYDAMLARLKTLETPILGPEVTAELTALANQYPDVFEFDAKRGMLRFKSDVTFDSGSDQLSSKAQDVLKKIASILNSGEASNLEVKVVGHTDNQPIKSVASKHPTNVHLSAHRAISVREALVHDGIMADRFQVAGYGEFRPVVANGPKGARENRRVEVFLAPGTWDRTASLPSSNDSGSSNVATRPTTTTKQPRANAPEEPTK
jgi:chemotaxis protein MotB